MYSLFLISCLLNVCEMQPIKHGLTEGQCWHTVSVYNKVAGVDEYSQGGHLLTCEIVGVPIPLRDWWMANTEFQ